MSSRESRLPTLPRRLTALLAALLVLAGCGQKGPLYLPPPEEPPTEAPQDQPEQP